MGSDLEKEAAGGDAPQTGTVVARKYKLIRVLGEGSYAWVYAASHESVESLRFAVKILKPAHSNNADVLRRFKMEANTIASLQSRHTVRVFDFGVAEDGLPYIVMEYIRGLSLRQLLQKEGRLHPLTAARLAAGVLKALVEAHGHGIVHRDLKPSNILVTRPQDEKIPIAKVLDFGIAKVVSADGAGGLNADETVEGLLFCSPRYASPEILNARPALQSDIYSLGIIMAEMLEGQAPYNGDNSILVAARHLSDDPVPLGPWVVESGYYNVIQKACAKRLDERYPTASAMLDDLEAAIRRLEALSGIRTEAQVAAIHPSVTGPFTLDGRSVHGALPREVTASATQPVAARDLRRSIEEQLRRTQAEPDLDPSSSAANEDQLSALLEEGTFDEEDDAAAASPPPLPPSDANTPVPASGASDVTNRPSPPPNPALTSGSAASAPAISAPDANPAAATPAEANPADANRAEAAPAPVVSTAAGVFDAAAVSPPPRGASRRLLPVVVVLALVLGGAVVASRFLPGADPESSAAPASAEAGASNEQPTPSQPTAPPQPTGPEPVAEQVPAAVDPIELGPTVAAARLPVLAALDPARSRITARSTTPAATLHVGPWSAPLPVDAAWVPLGPGVEISIQAEGFQPHTVHAEDDASRSLDAVLEPVEPARAVARPVDSRADSAAPRRGDRRSDERPTAGSPAREPASEPSASANPTPAQASEPASPPSAEEPVRSATEPAAETPSDSLRHSEIRNPWER